LREPAIGLRRAHAFILTRTNEAMETSGIINKLAEAKNIPIFKSIHQPKDLVAGNYNTRFPLSQLKGKKVYAFAGIANSGSFKMVLNETETQILLFDEFPDHYQYKLADVEQIRKKFSNSGADYLITTEKDGMRLRKFVEFFNTLYLLHIEMAMIPDKKSLENFLHEKIEAAK
jgi:tetraacyldisaccharide 4'-kinase